VGIDLREEKGFHLAMKATLAHKAIRRRKGLWIKGVMKENSHN
jgi:hypothetical protein